MILDFSAGFLGGVTGVIVGHPFDTVKVKLQAQPADGQVKKYAGTIDCFKKIFVHESALGFYKGVSSPLASLAFINAIVFGVYGQAIRRFKDPEAVRSQAAAGAFAGFSQAIVASPMELAKLRIQLQEDAGPKAKTYKGPLDCLQQVYKSGGTRALFRGLSLTFVRDMTGFSLYFAVYETITRYIHRTWNRDLTAADHLVAGGFAGQVSWMMNYPIDVVKTRFQSDYHHKESQYYQSHPNTNTTSSPHVTAPSTSANQIKPPKSSPHVTGQAGLHSSSHVTADAFYGENRVSKASTPACSRLPLASLIDDVTISLRPSVVVAYPGHVELSSIESQSMTSPARNNHGAPQPMTSSVTHSVPLSSSIDTHHVTTSEHGNTQRVISKYANVRDCITQCYRKEGIKVFVQGLTPTLLRAFPTNAVTFMTVAMVYKFFKSKNEEELLTT